MNKITRILAIVMAIAMVFGMTACGGETAPETTVAPTETTAAPTETVNVCETEGHAWVDATCDAAKTCSVCAATEGEALGHTWVDANYQQPKTCSVCAATEGEPITAAFVTNGWEINVTEVGKEYDYVTCYADDMSTDIVGKLFVDNYEIFASADGYPAKEGYEYRTATVKILFDDETARTHDIGIYNGYFNYYTAGGYEPNEVAEGEPITITVNWNGVDYTECQMFSFDEWSDWTNDGKWYTMTMEALVPVGYDGITFAFADLGNYVDENTTYEEMFATNALFFRMD